MTILELRARLEGGSGSGPFYNIFHIDCAAGDEEKVALAAGPVFETFYSAFGAYIYTGLVTTLWDRVVSLTDPPVIYNAGTPITINGSGPATQAAPQLAAVVSWATGLAGRSYRGRTYIGPLGSNAVQGDGHLNADFVTALQSAGADLIVDIQSIANTSEPPDLVVWSRTKSVATDILTCRVDNRVDTQRRRN